MIKKYSSVINGINYFFNADDTLDTQAEIFFDYLRRIPEGRMRDGYKLEIGFSIYIFSKKSEGFHLFSKKPDTFQITVPNYVTNPFAETTDNLSLALWIMLGQFTLLNTYHIEGASCRFDDKVIVEKGALESKLISLQRFSDVKKGDSGWTIRTLIQTPDGKYDTAVADEEADDPSLYESLYAYELFEKRKSVMKVLLLPYEYIAYFDGDELKEILTDKDECLINK